MAFTYHSNTPLGFDLSTDLSIILSDMLVSSISVHIAPNWSSYRTVRDGTTAAALVLMAGEQGVGRYKPWDPAYFGFLNASN
ncbi:hypothetical protein FRB98_002892, partial [Tulasnella sp. 332]